MEKGESYQSCVFCNIWTYIPDFHYVTQYGYHCVAVKVRNVKISAIEDMGNEIEIETQELEAALEK